MNRPSRRGGHPMLTSKYHVWTGAVDAVAGVWHWHNRLYGRCAVPQETAPAQPPAALRRRRPDEVVFVIMYQQNPTWTMILTATAKDFRSIWFTPSPL